MKDWWLKASKEKLLFKDTPKSSELLTKLNKSTNLCKMQLMQQMQQTLLPNQSKHLQKQSPLITLKISCTEWSMVSQLNSTQTVELRFKQLSIQASELKIIKILQSPQTPLNSNLQQMNWHSQ